MMKIILRGLVGVVVGAVSGAFICALALALLNLFPGGNRSLGGIGIISTPVQFSALIGAVLGAVYGAIVGIINALGRLGPIWGAVAGLTTGIVLVTLMISGATDTFVDTRLLWIIAIGGIIGLTTGSLLTILTKKIAWLSK